MRWFIFLIVGALIAGGASFAWACSINDMHLPMRIGASIVAISGFFAVLQIAIESQQEQAKAADKVSLEVVDDAVPLPFLRRVLAARSDVRLSEKRNVVLLLAISLALGELLHGWGDLLSKQICYESSATRQPVH